MFNTLMQVTAVLITVLVLSRFWAAIDQYVDEPEE